MIYKKYIFLVVSFLMMVFSISSALAVDDIISINGACGSAINQQWSTTPNSNLCAQGTAGTVQFLGSDPTLAYNWRWSCTSSNGGSNVDCGASLPATNGACGSAINQQWSTTPNSNLCAQGIAGTVQFLGSDPTLAYNWRWSCTSSNGGSNVDCGASKIIKTTSDDLKIKSLNLDKPLNQMNREELLKLLITLLMTLLGKN